MLKLYEKFENNRIVKKINGFQCSVWYPVCFAIIGALACSFDFDYILVYFITAATVFALLCNRDYKPMLVTAVLVYFILSLHGDSITLNISHYEIGHNLSQLLQLIINGSVMLAAIVFRLAIDGRLVIGLKKHAFMAGILAMCTAFALNGLFFEEYSIVNVWMAIIEFAGFFPIYYLMLCAFWGYKKFIPQLFQLFAILAGMITLEVFILFIKLHFADGLLVNGGINRDNIVLGWAINNIIAETLSLTVPATMYLAYSSNKKTGVIGMILLSCLSLVVIFLIQCRAALLFGGIAFAVSLIFCCIKGPNKKLIRIISCGILGIGGIIFFIMLFSGKLESIFGHVFGGNWLDNDSDRYAIWAIGLDNFRDHPIFGVGFEKYVYPDRHSTLGTAMYTQNMYHNFIVQFFASCGIVGGLALAFHLFELGKFFFKKRSVAVYFVFGIILLILATSLLDTFIFCPNISFFYSILLAAAEINGQEDSEKSAVAANADGV